MLHWTQALQLADLYRLKLTIVGFVAMKWKTLRVMRILLVLCAVLGGTGLAQALEFKVHPNNKSKTLTAILAAGDVELGDTEKLKLHLRSLPRKKNTAIYLASGGGNLSEGIKLGTFFREARIKTVIEGGYVCVSACALAFLGGTDNEGKPWRSSSSNSRLAFPAFRAMSGEESSSTDVQNIVSIILAYGHIVDAPMELTIAHFATPADEMFWVSNGDICALGIKLWSVETDKFVCND